MNGNLTNQLDIVVITYTTYDFILSHSTRNDKYVYEYIKVYIKIIPFLLSTFTNYSTNSSPPIVKSLLFVISFEITNQLNLVVRQKIFKCRYVEQVNITSRNFYFSSLRIIHRYKGKAAFHTHS